MKADVWLAKVAAREPAHVPIVELRAGDQAWAILSVKAGEERWTLVGTARVEVIAVIDATFLDVIVLLSSGAEIEVWRKYRKVLRVMRGNLYATYGEEHRRFGGEVQRFWGRNRNAVTK